MGETRFDALTRSLIVGSRRRALSGVLFGALGLVWPGGEDAAAHDLKAKCKKKSGQAKKKCLTKAKQHAAEHAAEDTSGGSNEQPPGLTCVVDGIKNGSETDIDCGGPSCDRCLVGNLCVAHADCSTAFCAGRCARCTTDEQCGSDRNGPCICDSGSGGTGTCYTRVTSISRSLCAQCPPYHVCKPFQDTFVCYPPCGAS